MNYKIPIIEKLYETYSALADNRIRFRDGKWLIDSSDYTKTYTIEKIEDTFISNDNMSFYKMTLGYPIISVLMTNNILEYNKDIIQYFKGINWKKINTELKNNYVKSAQMILNSLSEKGIDIDFIKSETKKTYEQLKNIKLKYIKSSAPAKLFIK